MYAFDAYLSPKCRATFGDLATPCCTAVGGFGRLERSSIMPNFKTISEKLSAWRRYRDAVRELSQLSDRELSDIGIRRGDIEFVVRRSVAAKGVA